MIREEFERDGLVILRGLLAGDFPEFREAWDKFYDATRTPGWNPVEVKGPFTNELDILPHSPTLRNAVRDVLGIGPRLYNFRFLVKDDRSPDAVFLHQDCGYHVGSMPKLSAFIAFSSVIPENGGLKFWLGTHRYGYLGDVGEINPNIIAKPEIVCPVLAPGDVVLMHSALWHESGPKVTGPDRVMADAIFQRADDPSYDIKREASLFVRSRSSRLIELQKQVDAK